MFLTSSDGFKIAYNLYSVDEPRRWLILVHMMPSTKESWKDFSEMLKKEGYESISIDLRGHGESDGGPGGYKNFGDREHQAGIKDVEAAWEFLKSRGAMPDKLTVIGASIGANLSLQFLIKNPEVQKGVLLSPGDYRGIDSGELVKKLHSGQRVLFVASRQDDRSSGNNAEQNTAYFNAVPDGVEKKLIIYKSAGHGTDFLSFEEAPNLTEVIKEFLLN